MRVQFKDFVKRHMFVLLGCLLLVGLGVLYGVTQLRPSSLVAQQRGASIFSDTSDTDLGLDILPSPAAPPAEVEYIMIHIVGAVYTPDVYSLPAGSRVIDAVRLAGGYTAYADLERVNLVAPLHDGQQVFIPRVGEEFTPAWNAAASGLININTATNAQLQTLPQIGDARANSVIAFRETNGPFARIEDLMLVTGIGDAIFNGLRELITVG